MNQKSGAHAHTGITHRIHPAKRGEKKHKKISVLSSQRMWCTACQSLIPALPHPHLTSQHDGLLYCSADSVVRMAGGKMRDWGFVFVQTLVTHPRIFPSRSKRHIVSMLVGQMEILPHPHCLFEANLDLFPLRARTHQAKKVLSCQKANVYLSSTSWKN